MDNTPKLEKYNGSDIIVLNPDDKYKLQFGQKKAKMIVENIDAVAHFAETGELLEATPAAK